MLLLSCSQPEILHPKTGSIDALIPAVREIDSDGELGFYSDGELRIAGLELLGVSSGVVDEWIRLSGLEMREGINPNLIFELSKTEGEEAYKLKINQDVIRISAEDEEGLFRGWTTMTQIMPASSEIGGLTGGLYPRGLRFTIMLNLT